MSNEILHNPENDSYGFKLVYEKNKHQNYNENYKRWAQYSADVRRIESYCKSKFHEDQWYLFRVDIDSKQNAFFWFETRNMAIEVRLSA